MNKVFAILILVPFLLTGCSEVQSTTEPAAEVSLPTQTRFLMQTMANDDPVESPTVDTPAAAETKTTAPTDTPVITETVQPIIVTDRRVNFNFLPPEAWFTSEVTVNDMQAYIYTNQDANILLQEEIDELPANFAAGAIAISPLPEGIDIEAMNAGLETSLDQYDARDLESFLIVADQIGLIDITAVQEIHFLQAGIEDLNGVNALKMAGLVEFEAPERLHIQIWLTWTESSFITIFETAHENHWQAAQADFLETRKSMQFP